MTIELEESDDTLQLVAEISDYTWIYKGAVFVLKENPVIELHSDARNILLYDDDDENTAGLGFHILSVDQHYLSPANIAILVDRTITHAKDKK